MSTSTVPLTHGTEGQDWVLPDRGIVGMLSLIIAETAIFTIFVVAYVFYMGRSSTGPQPRQVLELPIFNTVCLLSSSLTIWIAERALKRSAMAAFNLWWALTVVLAAIFLGGTAQGVAQTHLSRWPDHQHQPVRHYLLFAGWVTRHPRHHRR